MALDALLQEILVDPEDKQPLWYFEGDALLYNHASSAPTQFATASRCCSS